MKGDAENRVIKGVVLFILFLLLTCCKKMCCGKKKEEAIPATGDFLSYIP